MHKSGDKERKKQEMSQSESYRLAAQRYLARDLDDLLSELASYYPTPREGGREVFQRIRKRLHQKICVEWDYCTKRRSPTWQDQIDLVVAVSDTLVGLKLGAPVPVVLVAAILVKIGLNNFCNCG
jgi:hypothetical protein